MAVLEQVLTCSMVVWVTGASSGIGEELAFQLSKLGVSLVLSARRVQELERVKRRCLGESIPDKQPCFLEVRIQTQVQLREVRGDGISRSSPRWLQSINGSTEDKDILVLPLDLADRGSHDTAVKAVLQEFGR
ncbi:hypothetical protein A6R68_11382, partial [Neotoma lepida]